MNNYPDNNKSGPGARNQLPRQGSVQQQQQQQQRQQLQQGGQTLPRTGAPAQNGYPQSGYGYPQNSGPAQNPQNRPAGERPVQPRQNPQNANGAYPAGGAYTPQAQQRPQGRAYSYNNHPASATGAAYGPGSAAGRRQRDAMVNRQAVQKQKREPAKRVKKPFRFNWGLAVFFLLCVVVIGVSVWQISQAGWNETGIAPPSGPVVNAEPGGSGGGTGLPDAPEAGETVEPGSTATEGDSSETPSDVSVPSDGSGQTIRTG